MTCAHAHKKACEAAPHHKAATAQDNTDYCQLNGRLHSTGPLSGGGQAMRAAAGEEPGAWPPAPGWPPPASCPNQSETRPRLRWHRIRMRPTWGQYSHAAVQGVISHGQGEFIFPELPNCSPGLRQTDSVSDSEQQCLPQRPIQEDILLLAALNVSSEAVSVIRLQKNGLIHPPTLSSPTQTLQLFAETQRTSGPFPAPLNTQCLSGTLFGNRSINSLLWGKLHQSGVPALAPVHPFSLTGEHMGCFQVRLDESEHVHERVRGWDQGVNYIRTGFPAQYTSRQNRNNGVTFTNWDINEHIGA